MHEHQELVRQDGPCAARSRVSTGAGAARTCWCRTWTHEDEAGVVKDARCSMLAHVGEGHGLDLVSASSVITSPSCRAHLGAQKSTTRRLWGSRAAPPV